MRIRPARLAKHLQKVLYLCAGLVMLSVQLTAPVYAIDQADSDAIHQWPLWNPGSGACNTGGGATGVNVTGNNIKIAYAFFAANGYSPAQAAGIIGNLDEESGGVNPTQGEIGGGGGYGIAQWTPPTAMIAWVSGKNGDSNSLGGQSGKPAGQLDFLLYDLNNGETAARDAVKKDTAVDDAAADFMTLYERPLKGPTEHLDVRQSDAEAILAKYGNQTPTPGGDEGSCTSGAGGCVNPFSKVKKLGPERIDMGVDYTVAPSSGDPILAMCDAKILGAASGGTGWDSPTNTQAGVYLQLTSGPYAGKTYYVTEDIAPTVKTGDTVKAGQEIATFLPSATGIETGWGSGTPYGALAAHLNQQCMNGDPGCWSSAAGVSFNKFLMATGAKSGVFVAGAPKQAMPAGYP